MATIYRSSTITSYQNYQTAHYQTPFHGKRKKKKKEKEIFMFCVKKFNSEK